MCRRRVGVIKDLMCEWLRGKQVEKLVELRLQWADSPSERPPPQAAALQDGTAASVTSSVGLHQLAPESCSKHVRVWRLSWPEMARALLVQTNSFLPVCFVLFVFLPSRMTPNSSVSSKPPFNSNQQFLPSPPPRLTRFTISLIY